MGGFGGTANKQVSIELINRLIKSNERSIQGQITVYNLAKDAFKELRDELPMLTPDNIDDVRAGNFSNPNNVNATGSAGNDAEAEPGLEDIFGKQDQ